MVFQALTSYSIIFCAICTPAVSFASVSFKEQAAQESKSARASCDKFKEIFAPLEAKEAIKGKKVLKNSSDVEKSIGLIEAREAPSSKRNELVTMFFNNSKPTKTDVNHFIGLETAAPCTFPMYNALIRTVETAGSSNDSELKEKTRAMLKRWFPANASNGSNLIFVMTSQLVFDRALSTGILKGNDKDGLVLKEIAKEGRQASNDAQERFRQLAGKLSNIDEPTTDGKPKDIESYDFDPVKLQSYLADERQVAIKLNARLKSWISER